MFNLRYVLHLLACLGAITGLTGRLAAQQTGTQSWDVVNILVPEDLQEQKLPNDYWPFDKVELEKKLDEMRQLELQRQLSPMVLSEAVYIGTLNHDTLSSELSGWRFSGGSAGDTANLGKVSVAMRDARGLPDGLAQLSDWQWFSSDGAVHVELDRLSAWRWFGFQAVADRQSQVRRFTLDLPRALKSCMLLSVDGNLKLSSEDVVVVPVEDPKLHLPSDWPTEVKVDVREGIGQHRWWFLNLAGVARFTLEVDMLATPGFSTRLHSLKRESHRYSLSQRRIDVVSHFEFASGGLGQPIHLRLEKNHRIKTIQMDGQAVSWSYLAQDLNGSLVILQDGFARPDLQLQVATLATEPDGTGLDSGTAHASEPGEIRLPRVQLVGAFALTGTTQVIGNSGLVVQRVESDMLFSPELLQPVDGERRQGAPLTWTSHWVGQSPLATAHWKLTEPNWISTTITNLSVQHGTLSSLTRIRLRGENWLSNQMRIPIGADWQVDNLSLSKQVVDGPSASIQADSAGAAEIVVDWSPLWENLEFELEIQSHQVLDRSAEQLEVDASDLLQLPSGKHSAFFVFDQLGGYRLRFDAGLMQMVVPRRELETWQQAMVPGENAVVYKSQSDQGCQFTLLSAAEVVSNQSVVSLKQQNANRWQARTWVVFEPREGQVDHVSVALPVGQKLENWSFEIISSKGDKKAIDAVEASPTSDQVNMLLQLRLPKSLTERFILCASTELSCSYVAHPASLDLPLLTAVPASINETLVLLPDRWMLETENASQNLMHSGACCHSDVDTLIAQSLGLNDLELATVARVDNRLNPTVTLTQFEASLNKGWIGNELMEHQVFDNGRQLHRLDVVVQAVDGQRFVCNLPAAWQLKRLAVNEKTTSDYVWSGGRLEIPLTGATNNRVQVEFESSGMPDSWLEALDLSRPSYDVPVMQRDEKLLLSPSSLMFDWQYLGAGGRPEESSHWSLRLRPWSWYIPFASEAIAHVNGSSTGLWNEYLLLRHADQQAAVHRIWIVNRNAIFTLMLAGMMAVAAISWALLRRSRTIWWLVLLMLGLVLALIPENLLLVSQWLLLSLILGGMIRTAELAVSVKRYSIRPSNRPKSSVSQATTTSVLLLLTLGSVQAQDNAAVTSKSTSRTFGVFVPTDQQHQPIGDFVYIPTTLRDLLLTGGDSNPQDVPVRFLSAQYILKLRQPQSERGPVQEFSVDLRVQSTNDNAEILLPFRSDQLPVVSAPMLNGRPRMMGARNFKLAPNGEGIVFRPEGTGVFEVRLQFDPVLRDGAAGQFQLDAAVPPIPNATLRVVTEVGQANSFTVNALGGTQRTFLGDTIAYLGALERLNIRWSASGRPDTSQTAKQMAETWVHAQGNLLWAACQLTISNGNNLPTELDLLVDADWEPAGLLWGEAELVNATPVSTVGKRTLYRVRISSVLGRDSLIRMLLVPRESTSSNVLDIPFLSLERIVSNGKIFWWSGQDGSDWVPDTSDSPPVGFDTFSGWGPDLTNIQRAGFRVLGTGVKLRRNAVRPALGSFSELSTLHMRLGSTTLDFEATWNDESEPGQILWARVPTGSKVQRIEINGKAAQYQVSEDPNLIQIVSNEDGNKQTQRLLMTLDTPVILDRVEQVPRIELLSWQPRDAVYQIYRGAGLNVEVEHHENGVQLNASASASRRPISLGSLEVFVDEVKLDTSVVGSRPLPIYVKASPAELPKLQSMIMLVRRSEKNWTATVECLWGAQAGVVDYGFFEVPLALRDRLSAGQQVCNFMPHTDPAKTNLCIPIPGPDSQGIRKLQFSFPLDSVDSTQSVILPQVVSHHSADDRLFVSLPERLGDQSVRWLLSGAPLQPLVDLPEDVLPVGEAFRLYELSSGQTALSWQLLDQQSQEVQVNLLRVDITGITASDVFGHVRMWVQPRGQNSLDIAIPKKCQVLGIHSGDRPALWSPADGGLRVTLQPNYLPVPLQLSVVWQADSHEDLDLECPRPLLSKPPGLGLLSIADQRQWQPHLDQVSVQDGQELWVDSWAQVVIQALGSVRQLSQRDVRSWVNNWRPEAFQIESQATINDSSLQAKLSDLDLNDDGAVQVQEVWSSIQLLNEDAPALSALPYSAVRSQVAVPVWKWTGTTIQLARHASPKLSSTGYFVALAWFVLAFTVLWIVRKMTATWLGRLSRQDWFLWLVLALTLWCLLPIAWPSWVAWALCAWAAVNQLLELRRHLVRTGGY